MPEKPLLIFPAPSEVGRYKLHGGSPKSFNSPSKEQQLARIQPTLDALEATFRAQRIALQSDVSGIEPEMILVLEIRGVVEDFFKAVRKIPELEWLGELEKNFEPDEFFYYTDSTNQLKGKFFFILTNYQALGRILTLWRNYKYGRKFDRGTTKWRDVFNLLYDLRPWGVQDRITETGILEDWNYRIQTEQEFIPFEMELWFRKTSLLRQEALRKIQELIEQFGGEILTESIIEEIAYHGILAKAPIQIFNNLSEQTEIDFFKASDIMFLRPVGQCAIKIAEEIQIDEIPDVQESRPSSDPIVALLDGLPLQNHVLLSNRLIIDDPDNYGQDYLATARFHGTSMSSIIIHGDIEENNNPIKSRLYVRPVMKALRTFRGDVELIPEEVLVVDLIHRAVKRIFEDDGTTAAVAPSVKIINLSIGDPFRVLDHSMSSWAKVLDWLSYKYNVLFLVSAGNYPFDLDYSYLDGTFHDLLNNKSSLRKESLKVIYNNNRYRKIISPAESINAITVGASDCDKLTYQTSNGRILLFESPFCLSPLSRMGLGYKRSIKPELLVPGGRALYREKIGQSSLTWIEGYAQPGIKVAIPSTTGSLNGTAYTNGTSNSTAKLSHLAAKLHENLLESELDGDLTNAFFPLIAKNLLVHCASWHDSSVQEILQAIDLENGNERDLVARFLGYGSIVPERVFECTDKRVTLIGYGSLTAEQAHLFKLPIPVAISGSTLWRSLTLTLAWFSPVNVLNQTYRQAKLWFDFPDKGHENILSISRKFYDNDTVKRGTIQHEIFDGTSASAFLEGTDLPIRVNCKEDALGLSGRQIKYALAATLEVSPSLQTDIYNDIRIRIRPRIPISE